MVGFTSSFFKSVFLAIVYASSALALTVPTGSKHATHRVRSIANNVKIEVYHPESAYEVSRQIGP
jgi:extracellular elastinolytic metalloproteinase